MKSRIRRVALSTGGGDAPGLNAVINAATLAARNRDWDVIGIRDGLNGLLLVALAGPFSNVIMAVILAAAALVTSARFPDFAQYLADGVQLSLYLAIFNMLPVPPLDGSKLLLAARIPISIYREIARAGFMLLIIAVGFTDIGRWMAEWSDAGARAIFGALK